MTELLTNHWRTIALPSLLLLVLTAVAALIATQPWAISAVGVSLHLLGAAIPLWGSVLLGGLTLSVLTALGMVAYCSDESSQSAETIINNLDKVGRHDVITMIINRLDNEQCMGLAGALLIKGEKLYRNVIPCGAAIISKSNKLAFFANTRTKRAHILRDHIMDWRYDKIKKLVSVDPKVLSIVCDYKMNRWQEDSQQQALSALEYAWAAGDETLMALFDELGANKLDQQSYSRRDELVAHSIVHLSELSKALECYGQNYRWPALKPYWVNAPHWVYGLAQYFYQLEIIRKDDVLYCCDVFSDTFRVACYEARLNVLDDCGWGWACDSMPWRLPDCVAGVAVYLSELHTHNTVSQRDQLDRIQLNPSIFEIERN